MAVGIPHWKMLCHCPAFSCPLYGAPPSCCCCCTVSASFVIGSEALGHASSAHHWLIRCINIVEAVSTRLYTVLQEAGKSADPCFFFFFLKGRNFCCATHAGARISNSSVVVILERRRQHVGDSKGLPPRKRGLP